MKWHSALNNAIQIGWEIMMTSNRREVMRRVRVNREFINLHKERKAIVYEVTQLLSSFLLVLHLNWDDLEAEWPHIAPSISEWPIIEQYGLKQTRQAVGKIRDAFAHGLYTFEEGQKGEIEHIYFWTCPRGSKSVDWSARLSVKDLEDFLGCFCAIAEKKVGKMPQPLVKGNDCAPRQDCI